MVEPKALGVLEQTVSVCEYRELRGSKHIIALGEFDLANLGVFGEGLGVYAAASWRSSLTCSASIIKSNISYRVEYCEGRRV